MLTPRRIAAVAVPVAVAGLSGLLATALAATRPAAPPAAAHASARARPARQPATPVVTVDAADPVPPIPGGFVGLSMEYQSAAQIAGSAAHPNTVFQQLVRDLTPGQTPVLRIGGDSTDHTWWPARGIRRSPGLQYPLTRTWMRDMKVLADDLGAQLILGINLEADSPRLAAIEGKALLRGIGSADIEAFEVGNEPSLYAALPWYTLASGRRVPGRPAGYDYRDFARQFHRVAASLGSVPLAGPALGAPSWMKRLRSLLRKTPALQIVTYHRYPLDRCFTGPKSPMYPTIPNLLSATGTLGLAAVIKPFATIARNHGRQFRVDELNSVACSGQLGVSDTFASALWILDTLFAFARDGATGVNIHTFPTAAYRLFSFSAVDGYWSATVQPEYYGLLMFGQAAPPGSQLLHVVARGDAGLAAWATSTPAGTTNVVLINKSPSQPAAVTLRAPVDRAAASVERLLAPSMYANSGVTLGGASFAVPTTTGRLATAPHTTAIEPADGTYTVDLPAASAALVTVPGTTAADLQSPLR